MTTQNTASCLIRTREEHVGFPDLFSHYPKDMPSDTAAHILKYVDAAMRSVEELYDSKERARRVVLLTGGYLVMGVACFLRELIPDAEGKYNHMKDFGNRTIQGFVGCVWNLSRRSPRETAFPSMETFAMLIKACILPHWHEPHNSTWAQKVRSGIPAEYDFPVSYDEGPAPSTNAAINLSASRILVCPLKLGRDMVHTTLSKAISGGLSELSVCTNICAGYKNTPFMNATREDCAEPQFVKNEPVAAPGGFARPKPPDIPPKGAEKHSYEGLSKAEKYNRQLELKPKIPEGGDKFELSTNMPEDEIRAVLDALAARSDGKLWYVLEPAKKFLGIF